MPPQWYPYDTVATTETTDSVTGQQVILSRSYSGEIRWWHGWGDADTDWWHRWSSLTIPDTDRDGMPDGWEVSWGLLPLDPTDAALDPDNDHVTNLREYQIGTTPTGIYRVETRHLDTEASYPSILSTDDVGNIILTGQWSGHYTSDPDGSHVHEYQQEILLLPATGGEPIPLPPARYHSRSNADWTEYHYFSESPQFHVDPLTGNVHGWIDRHTGSQDSTSGYTWSHEPLLVADALKPASRNIPWTEVEDNLKQGPAPVLAS